MKRYKQQKIIRSQLDETLKQFSILTSVNRPMKGWIRAVRNALGMGMRQLATRMDVHTSRISKIESDEISGNLTLKTMEKVADSLDCVFVYGLVPRTSLEKTFEKQATTKATIEFNRLNHTMGLEAQDLSSPNQHGLLNQIYNSVVNSPSTLWDGNKKP